MEMRQLRILAWPLHAGTEGNPFVDLLYTPMRHEPSIQLTGYSRRRLALERWDIVHIHWPEWAIRGGTVRPRLDGFRFAALLEQARLRGARIVWTAHNLRPHEGTPTTDRFMRLFVHTLDLVIGLSDASLSDAQGMYPTLRRVQKVVVPHGHYRTVYPAPIASYADARRRLGLDHSGRTLLLLGQLRPYKNVNGLIRSFRTVASADDRLIIAGRPISEELARTIRETAHDDSRLLLRLEHIPDTDVPNLVRASDLLVLPYHAAGNSGAALLALSLDRPVLAPAKGSFPELAANVGVSWVQTYTGGVDDAGRG
jgi:glycosyltransferase involved in cell wall biosynthesis